jgi:hypothetical protein
MPAFNVSCHGDKNRVMLWASGSPSEIDFVKVIAQRICGLQALLYVLQGIFGRLGSAFHNVLNLLVPFHYWYPESTILEHSVEDFHML